MVEPPTDGAIEVRSMGMIGMFRVVKEEVGIRFMISQCLRKCMTSHRSYGKREPRNLDFVRRRLTSKFVPLRGRNLRLRPGCIRGVAELMCFGLGCKYEIRSGPNVGGCSLGKVESGADYPKDALCQKCLKPC